MRVRKKVRKDAEEDEGVEATSVRIPSASLFCSLSMFLSIHINPYAKMDVSGHGLGFKIR